MKKYYYTIGEVCNLLQLKPHVLRYWEKEFPSLRPKKGDGRNRKYSSDDIELLKKIQFMLYTQKFTIEGARKKLVELKKEKRQPEMDFIPDKEKTKREIIEEIKVVKKILQSGLQ
jgi:DNA-binding transcriptional MerR regulator